MVVQSLSILEKSIRYEPKFLVDHEVPVVWNKAKDCFVWDSEGKKYIDFTSGIFVTNVGHSHPMIIKAIKKQLKKCIHSYIFPTQVREELVGRLIYLTGMEKVLLTVTGSEANEVALQIMQRRKRGRILSIYNAYYGSTSGVRRLGWNGINEYVSPDLYDTRDVSGLFLQAFRGKDAKFMPEHWIQDWVHWAQSHDVPVAWDEMQSGFGRTGKMFGYQHYNIKPDLVCVGKAMGGGLPISAVIGRKDLFDYSDDLWSTHTGNPICCAAAIANLEIILKENLVERAKEIGKIIDSELRFYSIGFVDFNGETKGYDLNGRGAIWALDLGNKELVENVVTMCAEKGLLLVQTHAGTIKIAPPLTIKKDILIEGLRILKKCLR